MLIPNFHSPPRKEVQLLTSDSQLSRSPIRRYINYILTLLLTVVFVLIAFRDVDFSDVIEITSHASIYWTIILILSLYLSHFLRAVRWKIIIRSVKPEAKLKYLFGALMVGYGVNCVVPRLGEVSRSVLLGKWEGLSRSSMFGTVILERIIDIFFFGLSLIIAGLLYNGNVYLEFPWLKTTLFILLLTVVLSAILLIVSVKFKNTFYKLIKIILQKFSAKASEKLIHIFDMLVEGFSSLKGVNNYFISAILSVAIMLLYGFNSYIGFLALGMEKIQPINFAMAWIVMSVGSIGVMIPTPGGTGSYHTIAKSVLVLLFGFSETISLAYAFLMHIVSYLLFIFTALIVFFLFNKQHDNLIKVVETELNDI